MSSGFSTIRSNTGSPSIILRFWRFCFFSSGVSCSIWAVAASWAWTISGAIDASNRSNWFGSLTGNFSLRRPNSILCNCAIRLDNSCTWAANSWLVCTNMSTIFCSSAVMDDSFQNPMQRYKKYLTYASFSGKKYTSKCTFYTWYSVRSARNLRSLLPGISTIPSTITTKSRHSIK